MQDLDIQVGDIVTYEEVFGFIFRELITKENKIYYIKDFEILKIERIGQNGWYTVYEKKEREEILDEKEKEYLRNLIRPFKKDVNYIKKNIMPLSIVLGTRTKYCISIGMTSNMESFFLPAFSDNKMYKNMKIDKEYSLSELGLED